MPKNEPDMIKIKIQTTTIENQRYVMLVAENFSTRKSQMTWAKALQNALDTIPGEKYSVN